MLKSAPCLLLCCVAACNSAADPFNRFDNSTQGLTSPVPPRWSLVGRFAPGNANINSPQSVSWAYSTVLARVFNTNSVTVHMQMQGQPEFVVSLDNGTPQPLANGSQTFGGLAAGTEHLVRITKINETSYGTAVFNGISMDAGGAFDEAPAVHDRRIELIGDSISNGYGDLGSSAYCSGSATNEDVTQAYGPLTAAALGADLHVTAWSGRGLIRNLDLSTSGLVPQLWRLAVASDSSTVWDPTSWVPHAVVVNLGTNDFNKGIPDANAFVQGYTQFIATLRTAYGPQTHIFAAIGPMMYGDRLTAGRADIQQVVQTANANGDPNVHFIEFPVQVVASSGAGAGCDYHPNLSTHQSMANSVLVPAIRQALGW